MVDPDSRGQSVVIGTVLLFGMLVVSLALYQALVVPSQNEQLEYEHSERIQNQLQHLRSSILAAGSGSGGQAVSVDLGVDYPLRVFGVNPPPGAGTLSTVGTGNATVNLTVTNVTAVGGVETPWNGTTRVLDTGLLRYDPSYAVYRNPPRTVYEYSVLYNRFDGETIPLSDQQLVSGRTVNPVLLTGKLSASAAESVQVNPTPVSAGGTVPVTNTTSGPITLRLTTRLNDATWQRLLRDQREQGYVERVETVAQLGDGYNRLVIELDESVTYRMAVSQVGLGSGVEDPPPAYVAGPEGALDVPENETVEFTVEVRDRYDNPVANASVYASATVDGATVRPVDGTTDREGRVRFEYDAPPEVDDVTSITGAVNVSLDAGALARPFDAATLENTSVEIRVHNTDGSGLEPAELPYTVVWRPPTEYNDGDRLSDCSASDCTWSTTGTGDTLTLRSVTVPETEGLTIDFSVDDTGVGTVAPSANGTVDGNATTTLTARGEGTVQVFAASGGSADVVNVTLVENQPPNAEFNANNFFPPEPGEQVEFTAYQSSDPDGSIVEYRWDFGDGTTETTQSPSVTHTYQSEGEYTVTLTVVDDDGATDSISGTITVEESGGPGFPGMTAPAVIVAVLLGAAARRRGLV